MEKEKRTEEAIQVFRKMLVEEFGIKSTEQFFSTEGEDMAVIYESMKVEQEKLQSHRRRNKCCLRYNF